MNRSRWIWLGAAVLAVALAAVGYLFVAGGSGEPSTQLTTPPLVTATSAAEGLATFMIDPIRSQAIFQLDEVLRGLPNTVVGSTSEVAGQFRLDPTDLSTAVVSQIVINARTLQTDSSFRDRAIRGPIILNSATDEFELITFDPGSIDGLDGAAGPGETFNFTITGELHIKETTRVEAFDVVAQMSDENTISGTAEATVHRDAYGIGIPNAPGVAGVAEEVLIRLQFVATRG